MTRLISDDELDQRLEFAVVEACEDIKEQLGVGVEPFLARDPNGRYVLLDAYAALAVFRAARKFKE